MNRVNLDDMDADDLVSVGRVARHLGMSVSRVRELDRQGVLKSIGRTPGNARRYRVGTVREFRAQYLG